VVVVLVTVLAVLVGRVAAVQVQLVTQLQQHLEQQTLAAVVVQQETVATQQTLCLALVVVALLLSAI
jgi:uncharacterized membrane protein YdcZ (DUF606 family)